MSVSGQPTSTVYSHPKYYAIAYKWNTTAECNLLESCFKTYRDGNVKTLLDIGCGAGRHLFELARRGYRTTGIDPQPEMVAFVKTGQRNTKLPVTVTQGDLRTIPVDGPFDAAICLMDTFRFLLSNQDIVQHFRDVAKRLTPGGLYVTDFWIPMKWDQIANEMYQWEQTEGDTTVKVFYLQHPETIDPVTQTFEDELVFTVEEDGTTQEIRGGRTRTRLIMPQEFHSLVEASGAFDLVETLAEFDLEKPLDASSGTWRMISVLKKR